MIESERDSDLLQLSSEVRVIKRPMALLLVAKPRGSTIRVSLSAEHLLPLLARGASFGELREQLTKAYPSAGDVRRKLEGFLAPLARAGLIEDPKTPPVERKSVPKIAFRADGFFRRAAEAVNAVPGAVAWTVLGLLILGSVAGIAQLALSGHAPA